MLNRKLVGIKSVRIGDVVMQVYPAENPELVPEIPGPFYPGAQVSWCMDQHDKGLSTHCVCVC